MGRIGCAFSALEAPQGHRYNTAMRRIGRAFSALEAPQGHRYNTAMRRIGSAFRSDVVWLYATCSLGVLTLYPSMLIK